MEGLRAEAQQHVFEDERHCKKQRLSDMSFKPRLPPFIALWLRTVEPILRHARVLWIIRKECSEQCARDSQNL
eukprot:1674407-Amphidinium_carterae.1